MLKIFIFLIASLFLFLNASADVEWSLGTTAELKIGEKMAEGNYTIEVYNFPAPVEGYTPLGKDEERPVMNVAPFVSLRLYNSTGLVADWTLLQGETRSYGDDVKITVENLPKGDSRVWINKYYDPSARLKFQMSKNIFKESFVVIDFTAGKEYKPTSTIQLYVQVKNIGSEDAADVALDIQVNTGLRKKEGILKWQRLNNTDTLKKGEEITVPVSFYTPLLFDETDFALNVTAESTWQDRNRTKVFKASNTSNFTVRVLPQWDFTIQKSVKKEVHIGDIPVVSLTVQNTGGNDIDLEVVDTVPDGFTLLGGNLTWKPRLKKGDSWTETYRIKPRHPASLSLPPAKSTYRTNLRNYTVESNSPSLLIYGPYIVLDKAFPAEAEAGSNVTVTLKVSNTGDRLAIVNLTDRIPQEARFVYGITTAQLSLQGGESKTFEYVLAFQNTGAFTIPPAEASFYEHLYTTYRGVVTSEARTVNITAKPVAAAPPEILVNIEGAPEESFFARLSGIHIFSIPVYVLVPLVIILSIVIIFIVQQKARERKILKKYFK